MGVGPEEGSRPRMQRDGADPPQGRRAGRVSSVGSVEDGNGPRWQEAGIILYAGQRGPVGGGDGLCSAEGAGGGRCRPMQCRGGRWGAVPAHAVLRGPVGGAAGLTHAICSLRVKPGREGSCLDEE